MDEYDLCIIGAGMIGSCAAHHASKLLPPNSKLCMIGPDEPKDLKSDPERSIFGAYYDEGRLIRCTDRDQIWAPLGQRAYENYTQVQQESGIQFYTKTGALTVLEKEKHIVSVKHQLKTIDKHIEVTTWRLLKDKPDFNYYKFEDEHTCIVEYEDAGYVNPRQMVAAYQKIAKERGCQIFHDIVKSVSKNDDDNKWSVLTDNGHVIYAKKILVATGAFTAFRDVLPNGIKANIKIKSKTQLFAEVNQSDLQRFRNMPVLVTKTEYICYMLPPIKYPDGRYYIKIGHAEEHELDIDTEDSMRKWYQGTAPEKHKQGLWKMLHGIIPDFEPVSLHTGICARSNTPSGHPFIDLLQPTLGVALGGNGHAGKSCDEIGRLAAELVIKGKWTDPEITQTDFMFVASAKL